jgi:uncharacterized protein YqgC (DUF456 family)
MDMGARILLSRLDLIVVIAGLAGLVLPAVPGAPLIFAGLLVAAWAEDFTYVGTRTLVVLGVLALLTYPTDLLATALGAKRFRASPRSALGAALGAVVGLFFGLPGILLGPFLGAMLAELSAQPNLIQATRSGVGATLGLLLGVAMKMALAFTMIGVFVLVRFL